MYYLIKYITWHTNKVPSVSSFVKETDYNTKITEIPNKLDNHNHDKYITIPEFNTLAANVFNERLATFDNTVSSLYSKIETTKTVNTSLENLLKRLGKNLDLSYFVSKNYFEKDGTQNYLVFQLISRYFKHIAITLCILWWKLKGLSDETIKPPVTSDNSRNPLIDYFDDKIRLKFNGSCLK